MSDIHEHGLQTDKSVDSRNVWFDSLILNPFEKDQPAAPAKSNPFEHTEKEASKGTGKIEISPLEFDDYGLKRDFYKDDSGSGYATEYPHGLTVVRYAAGNFMLRLPAGMHHWENNDGLVTVLDSKGKKIATFEADGTLHVRAQEGTFTEKPNGDVTFEPYPTKGHKPVPAQKGTESKSSVLPEVTIANHEKSSDPQKKPDSSAQRETKPHKTPEQPKKAPEKDKNKLPKGFDPLEGLDLDNLGY